MTNERFAMIPLAALQADIGASALRLYMALRLRYRPGRATWQADESICRELGITVRAYRQQLREVTRAGLVRVNPDPVDGRRNNYVFPQARQTVKVPAAVIESGISGNALRVYAITRRYSSEAGVPLIEKLAEEYPISERSLTYGLNELTSVGFIVVKKRRLSRWRRRNVYEFPVVLNTQKNVSIPDAVVHDTAHLEDANLRVLDTEFCGPNRRSVRDRLSENVSLETVAAERSPAAVVKAEIFSVDEQKQNDLAELKQGWPGSLRNGAAIEAAYAEALKCTTHRVILWAATIYRREVMASGTTKIFNLENWLAKKQWHEYVGRGYRIPDPPMSAERRREWEARWYADNPEMLKVIQGG